MITIFMILFFVFIFLAATLAVTTKNEGFGILSFLSALVFTALFVAHFMVAVSHSHDLATIRAQHYVIEAEVQNITELEGRLSGLKSGNVALLNADTPIAALVTELARGQGRLSAARVVLAEARKGVEGHKVLFGWVIRILGEK